MSKTARKQSRERSDLDDDVSDSVAHGGGGSGVALAHPLGKLDVGLASGRRLR